MNRLNWNTEFTMLKKTIEQFDFKGNYESIKFSQSLGSLTVLAEMFITSSTVTLNLHVSILGTVLKTTEIYYGNIFV